MTRRRSARTRRIRPHPALAPSRRCLLRAPVDLPALLLLYALIVGAAIDVPPTVMPLISTVGMPTPTGTDCPSLPHVHRPSLSLKSPPTAVTLRRTSGP